MVFSVNGISFSVHSRIISWYSLSLSCLKWLMLSATSLPRVDGIMWASTIESMVRIMLPQGVMDELAEYPRWLFFFFPPVLRKLVVALYIGELWADWRQRTFYTFYSLTLYAFYCNIILSKYCILLSFLSLEGLTSFRNIKSFYCLWNLK